MSLQCSICLSSFKDPVCLPCGHLYCKKCIIEYVNMPTNDEMESSCPECRAAFHITIPDLTYLPKKYHPFISPAIRRVYIDVSLHNALQKKLKQAEKRLESKKITEEALLKKCEGLAAALDAHRAGEAEANESLEDLREKLDDAEDEYQSTIDSLRLQVERTEKENRKLKSRCTKLTNETIGMQIKIENMERRTNSSDEEDQSMFSSDLDVPMNVYKSLTSSKARELAAATRRIKPLPKRLHRRGVDASETYNSVPKRARI